jgi:hypothetical protein
MALQGHDADAIDRHEVLMLVAECDLQLRHIPDALDTLDLAAKESGQTDDWPRRAQAISLAAIVRAAPGLIYSPKVGEDHRPLNLTDPDQRKEAMQKLFDERYTYCSHRQRLGKEDESIQRLLDEASAFDECRALEQSGTGATQKTDALGDHLAVLAHKMID